MDKKALSLPILISLVVGNMIGTGIYLLPASLAEYGTVSLVAWVFTSLGAVFLALTFANLNKRFPKTGGPYVFCREAFGMPVGFLVAYIYWLSNLASIAGIAVASVGYLGYITPTLDANSAAYSPYLALAIELIMLWVFTGINIIGIHTAGMVQLFLTILKVLPLLIITAVGLSSIHLSNLEQFNVSHLSNFSAMTSAATLTFWAFIGLEAATVPAENTSGSKDIYRATMSGTLITSFIYIVSTFVLMGMIPIAQLKSLQFPFAQAGTMLFGSHAAFIIAICAVISGLGAMNVCILIQGEIVFAAARDHLFPHVFAKLSKHDVSITGQLLSSGLITLFLILTIEPTLLKQFNTIALLASLLTLVTYFATTLAQIRFLFTGRTSLLQMIFNKSTFIALLAACYAGWMISSFEIKMLEYGVIILIVAVPIYFILKRVQKSIKH